MVYYIKHRKPGGILTDTVAYQVQLIPFFINRKNRDIEQRGAYREIYRASTG